MRRTALFVGVLAGLLAGEDALADGPPEAPAPAPPKVSKPKQVAAPEPPPYVPFFTVPRILAGNAVGLGFVGIDIGIGFGVDALQKASSAKNHCSGAAPVRCDAEGQSLYSSARTSATASNIAFLTGAVLLTGGVILWLVAPRPSGEEPKGVQRAASIGLVPGFGGAMLRGEW